MSAKKVTKGPSGKACEVILYPEDGWTPGTIIAEINKRESVEFYAIILHDQDFEADGSPKKPHYHVYLSCKSTKWYFADVAKWFNISVNLVQRIKAKGRNARYRYLVYQLHIEQPEKHTYHVDEIIANFNVAKYIKDHDQQAKLDEVLELIADGTVTRHNYADYMDIRFYTQVKPKLERAWEYREAAQAKGSVGDRNLTVIWIAGQSKTGKTTLAKLCAKKMGASLYITQEGSHPFDGYTSEAVVLMDELRPNDPFTFTQLLQVLDPNTARGLNARYHNKTPYFHTVFVTTTYSPMEFYKGCRRPDEEALQMYRRITEYWDVDQTTITTFVYDYERQCFSARDAYHNPASGYLESLEKPDAFDSAGILGALEAEYTDKQLAIDGYGVFTPLEDADNTDNPFL